MKYLLVSLMLLVLCACASNQFSRLYQFQQVDSEGPSKLFRYGLTIGQGTTVSPADARRVSFADMRKELEKYMDAVQFCTQGYFVYNETFDGSEYLLHGECQESKGQ